MGRLVLGMLEYDFEALGSCANLFVAFALQREISQTISDSHTTHQRMEVGKFIILYFGRVYATSINVYNLIIIYALQDFIKIKYKIMYNNLLFPWLLFNQ